MTRAVNGQYGIYRGDDGLYGEKDMDHCKVHSCLDPLQHQSLELFWQSECQMGALTQFHK